MTLLQGTGFVAASQGAHYQFDHIHITQSDLISWKLIAATDKPACIFSLHPLSVVHYALKQVAFISFVSTDPNLLDFTQLDLTPLSQCEWKLKEHYPLMKGRCHTLPMMCPLTHPSTKYVSIFLYTYRV